MWIIGRVYQQANVPTYMFGLQAIVRTSSSEFTADLPAAVFPENTWTHVMVTWSPTAGLKMYNRGK